MYNIQYTNRFKKSLRRCSKRGLDLTKLEKAISILASTGKLPTHYKPHQLTGDYKGCMECHIQPDWLLIWKQDDNILTLLFLDTGSHSDLF